MRKARRRRDLRPCRVGLVGSRPATLLPQLDPGHVVIHPQPWCRLVESLDQRHQLQQLALGDRRTRPSCTSGSSRVRTTRPSPGAGRPRWPVGSRSNRIHVEAECVGNRGAARLLELGLVRYAGRAPASNLWKSRFSAVSHGRCPVGVRDDQRCIDGHQAIVADERRDRGRDARVVLRDADVQESAVGIDNRDAGLVRSRPTQDPSQRSTWAYCLSRLPAAVSCVFVTIPNVLANRYASDEMVAIWSPEAKVVAERRLWLAVLRAQAELGVDVPDGVVADYERVLDDVDLSSIAARERVLRHDVKARIEEFNALAGHEHVHKGMTSRDLTENVEQLQIRRSLELVHRPRRRGGGAAGRAGDQLPRPGDGRPQSQRRRAGHHAGQAIRVGGRGDADRADAAA